VPFVQGHLRAEPLSFVIDTQCGHCQQPIRIEIDGELRYRLVAEGAEPLVYVPMVDLHKLEEPSIIDRF
jgi:hypothetical protein